MVTSQLQEIHSSVLESTRAILGMKYKVRKSPCANQMAIGRHLLPRAKVGCNSVLSFNSQSSLPRLNPGLLAPLRLSKLLESSCLAQTLLKCMHDQREDVFLSLLLHNIFYSGNKTGHKPDNNSLASMQKLILK